jgi:hypothetical protein
LEKPARISPAHPDSFPADQALDVNLLHQFGQDFFEPPVTDERGGGDLG